MPCLKTNLDSEAPMVIRGGVERHSRDRKLVDVEKSWSLYCALDVHCRRRTEVGPPLVARHGLLRQGSSSKRAYDHMMIHFDMMEGTTGEVDIIM